MRKLNRVERDIVEWNSRFPVDRWWRKKYNAPFMSRTHRESSFLDQLREFYEDRLFNEETETEEEYIPNSGDIFKTRKDTKQSLEDLQREFEDEFLKDG